MGVPTGMMDAMSRIESAPFSDENRSLAVAMIAAFALTSFVNTYLWLRLGYVLPHICVSKEPSGFFDAFMKTDPLRWPLVIVALLVMIAFVGSLGLFTIPSIFWRVSEFPDMLGPVPTKLALMAFVVLIVVLQMLVGASIQTEVYRIVRGIDELMRKNYAGGRRY